MRPAEKTQPVRLGARVLRDRRVLCWAMYDWANSAYTTLMITVVVAYIQRVVYPVDEWGTTGAVVWAWGISLSMFLGAILSPCVGAIADATRNKRGWLAGTAGLGATACVGLGLISPEYHVLVVALFVCANLCLELSLGVYNGFLPEIAKPEETNAASAWGYGLGYLGGGIALGIAMIVIQYGAGWGAESVVSRLRICIVLMGCWWGLFTIPAILVLRDPPLSEGDGPSRTVGRIVRGSLTEVWQTTQQIRLNRPLAFFLVAFLLYNDGVQTVISQASTFALSELSMPEAELMGVILMIQFLAMPGAILIAKVADWFGKRRALLGCLATWCIALISALWIKEPAGFWILAAVIALVLGGTQSVSRSLMSDMIPEEQNAKYFGFFNLSGKATSFIGTFIFGLVIAMTDSSRLAIIALVPLFVVGSLLLYRVRQDRLCG